MSVTVLVVKSYLYTAPGMDLSCRQGNDGVTHTISSVTRTRVVIRWDIQNPGVGINDTLMGHECVVEPRNRVPYEIKWFARRRSGLNLQVSPASSDTKMLSSPRLATPTKMRGVGYPLLPVVWSNVTKVIPIRSLMYSELRLRLIESKVTCNIPNSRSGPEYTCLIGMS